MVLTPVYSVQSKLVPCVPFLMNNYIHSKTTHVSLKMHVYSCLLTRQAFGSISYIYSASVKRFKLDPEVPVGNPSTRVASTRKQEPPLPMWFDLSRNFQPKIQAGLDEKNLTGWARAKLITSITEAIYPLKSYPTKEEYECVANQVVKKLRNGHFLRLEMNM